MAVYVFSACRPTHWVERSVVTHSIKQGDKKRKKPEDTDAFSKVKHRLDNGVASLSMHT